MSEEKHNMKSSIISLIIIGGLIGGGLLGYFSYQLVLGIIYNTKPNEENWITKYPHLIEGIDSSGKFYMITFDNGTKLETKCPSHTYPFETNDTSYICGNEKPIRVGDYNK
jgi:hypothetical protein